MAPASAPLYYSPPSVPFYSLPSTLWVVLATASVTSTPFSPPVSRRSRSLNTWSLLFYISALSSNWARRIAHLALFNTILFTLGWEATTATICSAVLAVLRCALAINILLPQRKDVVQDAVAFATVGTLLVVLPLVPVLAYFANVPVFFLSHRALCACWIFLQLLAYLRFFILQLPTFLFTAQVRGLPPQQDGSVFQLLSLFLSAF